MSSQFDKEKSEAYDKTPDARLSKLEMEQLNIKVDIAVLKETCATKTDLAELGGGLRAEMAEMGSQLRAEMAAMGSQLRAEMAAMESQLHAEMAAMEGRLRAEMAEMENRLKTQIAETKSTIIIWVVGSVFLAQLLPALLKYLH